MSNIDQYLQKIISSRYGKDVRQSIHDAIEEIDKVADTAQGSAAASAEESKQNALSASTNAKEAEQFRNEAKQFRNEAEGFAPENYTELVKTVEENTVKIDSIIEKAELTIKNIASGESVHLTDSADNKIVEFALYGKAKQNTESSKNILNPTIPNGTYGNIQVTVNSDKSILLNGTSENRYNYSYPISTNIIPEESGGYRLNGSPSDYCSMYVVHSGSEDRAYTDSTKTVRQSLNQGASNKEVYYYLEAGVSYDVRINLPEYGIDLNNITLYPMLRPANTDNTYEPYTGPIPNPDNLQEIKVSGADGSVEVKSRGKNLAKTTLTTRTNNNVTFTVNDDGSVKVTGIPTAQTNVTVMLGFEPNFSGIVKLTGASTSECHMYAWNTTLNQRPYTDASKTVLQTKDNDKNNLEVPFYVEAGEKYNIVIRILGSVATAGTNLNHMLYPMISFEGGEFEPYKEIITTILTSNGLSGIPVDSGGNYTDVKGQQWICDEFVKYADGTGEKIQRIKKVVFDGVNIAFTSKSSSTANNIFMADQKTKDFKPPSSDRELANVISSHFTTKASYYGYREGTPCIYGNAGYTNLYFGFGKDTDITTVALANEWLKSNNVTVYYELAEAIRTPLTAEEIAEIEKLQTFYPVTNFTNDSDCGMKVTYLADSKNYIDNQLAIQAQAQETAMINMLLLLPDETQAAMIENDTNNLLTESEE